MNLKSALLAATAVTVICLAAVLPLRAQTIQELIPDQRPSTELSDAEIAGRVDALQAALTQEGLPKDLKQQLRKLLKTDQEALNTRSGADQQAGDAAAEQPVDGAEPPKKRKKKKAEEAPAEQPGEQPVDQANEPAAEPPADQPVEQAKEPDAAPPAEQPVEQAKEPDAEPPAEQPVEQAKEPAAEPPAEQPVEQAAEPAAEPPADQPAEQAAKPAVEPEPLPNTPAVVSELETKAVAMLNDGVDAASLDKEALKARLDTMRDLLDEGNIDPETSKALRKKLKAERDLMRALIAKEELAEAKTAEAEAKSDPAAAAVVPLAPVAAPTVAELPKIVADEREATDLGDRDLNKRIRGFRASLNDKRFKTESKSEFVATLEEDRAELKRRLLKKKKQRVVVFQKERKQPKVEVNLSLNLNLEQHETPSVWAAEADDREIEEYLTARPVRKLPRQYKAPRRLIYEQPERYVARREVRESLPSVEVDTISFGFGEAVVREEEIVNLDRIGLALERILAGHPDEVFLIEGHTDAVGSDAFNLKLSKARAIAVKRALISYYSIPAEALATAGLGERYLKIWTPEPEQENRRVTLRRLTSLVSDDDSDGGSGDVGEAMPDEENPY